MTDHGKNGSPRHAENVWTSALETRPAPDIPAEARAWLRPLRATGSEHDEAAARLHGLLLRAALFEVSRRGAAVSHVRGEELDDLAVQAADDALVAVLAKLDDYRGASRFTTWASTRRFTTRAASCAPSSPREGSRWTRPSGERAWLRATTAPPSSG